MYVLYIIKLAYHASEEENKKSQTKNISTPDRSPFTVKPIIFLCLTFIHIKKDIKSYIPVKNTHIWIYIYIYTNIQSTSNSKKVIKN